MSNYAARHPVKPDPMDVDNESPNFVCRGPSLGNKSFNVGGFDDTTGSRHSTMTPDQYPWGLPYQTTDSGLDILGGDMKKLINGIQKLRHIGIEDLNVPLPKIVVVGDQSTGKSSLIEGMSEIKVPREAGCCTRCPLEINLAENEKRDAWVCNVFLHKKYVYEGTEDTTEDGASDDKPLGPWTVQNSEDYLFATTTTKSEVEGILKCAQLATLNPSESYEKYKPNMTTGMSNAIQVKFSPNVVRVDISGPGLPNLSFTDLPGVINDPEIEDERYLIMLVKNLVKDYIRADSSINLLALPMTTDATNCTAAGIVKEVHAQDRTIGVLTKPDKLDKNDLTQWISILEGQKFKLGFGYFVVKNNPDANVDHLTARKQEEDFFENEVPFTTKLRSYKDQFGTKKLQAALSQRLTSKIKTSLPRIETQINHRAAVVKAELATLPEKAKGNLQLIVHTKISEFARELQMHLDGGSEDCPFQFDWNKSALRFRKAIAESRPMFSLTTTLAKPVNRMPQNYPATPSRGERNAPTVISDSDDNVRRKHPPARTPKKRDRSTDAAEPGKSPKHLKTDETMFHKRQPHQFSLAEIRNVIRVAYVELPGHIHPKSIERMIRISIQHWENLTTRFLDETKRLCEQLIKQRVDDIFGPLKPTELYRETIKFCGDFIGKAVEEQRAASMRSFMMEVYKPMTFNEEALNQACETARRYLQSARHKQRCGDWLEKLEERTGKCTAGPAREKELAKITDAQLGIDEYSQEIVALGKVRGYYDHASSRYVDAIGQGVQCELFNKCRNELPSLLVRTLGIDRDDANEKCDLLLAVDKKSMVRRVQLEREERTLVEAKEQLRELEQDTPGGENSQDASKDEGSQDTMMN